jgi:hypothetical protein
MGEGIGLLHSKKGQAIVALAGHVIFITRDQFESDSLAPAASGPGPGGKTHLWQAPLIADGADEQASRAARRATSKPLTRPDGWDGKN